MIEKVIVYVVRLHNQVPELLVFEHVDVDAGIQVPKGTVESDETPEHAAIRELFEETGLRADRNLHPIGTLLRLGEKWSFFALMTDAHMPGTWRHCVGGVGEDAGMQFRFHWLPLTSAPELAGRQGDGLQFIKIPSASHISQDK